MNEPDNAGGEKLSTREAETLAGHLAQTSGAGLPLAAGLHAAAAEADSARLRRTLHQLATAIERGSTLPQALQQHGRRLPPHVAGILQASAGSDRFAVILAEWIENQRAAREQWRTVTAALAYPMVTVLLAVGVFLLVSINVVPQLRTMYQEFGMKLAPVNEMIFRANEIAVPIIFILAGVVAIGALGVRLIGGRAGWSQTFMYVPLLGNIWHWSGAAEMLRVLGLLVEEKLNLPAALRSAASGVRDAHLARVCSSMALDIERGIPLWQAIEESRNLPHSIVPLVRWGEQHDLLPDALRTAAEMLEGRLRSSAQLLVIILPPLVFVAVTGMILTLAASTLAPMIGLIQGLT